MIKIGIIIVNWQQAQLTINTIESVLKIKHSNFEFKIFLVDNGSKDNCVAIFTEKYSHNKLIELVLLPQNYGFSVGNNYGIQAALKSKFDYLLLLNSDVIVDQYFLEELLKPCLNNNQIGMIGPKIYFAPGMEYHKDRYKKSDIGNVLWSAGGTMDWNNIYTTNVGIDEIDNGQYDLPLQNLEFITNCCVLVKTEVFSKVGLMPDEYFMYCEDTDFCQQIFRYGYKIAFQPTSKIWHVNSGSSQAGGGPFHDYFLTRNRLILGKKYAGFRTNFALFRESVRLLFKGTPWQKKGVVDFYLGKRKKGSWK